MSARQCIASIRAGGRGLWRDDQIIEPVDAAGLPERVRRGACILLGEAEESDRREPMLKALTPHLGPVDKAAIGAAFIEVLELKRAA